MSLDKMDLRDLVKNLVEISTLVDEAQESQSVHAPPEIQTRGQQQYPILLKVEEILSEELHGRLGYSEMADVAISAMEEHIEEAGLHESLAGLFGALKEPKSQQEERKALGYTIAELEARERAEMDAFEFAHPEIVRDRELLYTAREQIDRQLARQARVNLDPVIDGERDWTPWQPASFRYKQPKPDNESLILHISADGSWSGPSTVAPTHKLEVTEAPSPILQAMRDAAGDSLEHLATEVLLEYLKLWRKKHHDYGVENHAVWGCQGAVIRATDKLMRLKGRYFDGRMMKTDKTEDDWLDLIGYGLIGLIIERGQWPTMKLCDVIAAMEIDEEEQYAGEAL